MGVDGDEFPVRLVGCDAAAAAAAVAAARSVDDSVEVVSLIRFNKAKFAKDTHSGRISELLTEERSDSSGKQFNGLIGITVILGACLIGYSSQHGESINFFIYSLVEFFQLS